MRVVRVVNGDGAVAVGEAEADTMKGETVRGRVVVEVVQGLRGGVPAVVLGGVGANHVALPFDGAGNADRVDEGMLKGPANGLADAPAGVGGAETDGVFTGKGLVVVGGKQEGTEGEGD